MEVSTPPPPPSVELPPQKPRGKLHQKLAESRFFTMSLAIHMVLIFFLGGLILFKSYQEPEDFAAEGDGLMGDGGDSAVADSAPADSVPTESYVQEPDLSQPDMADILTSNSSTASFTVAANVVAPNIEVKTDTKATSVTGVSGLGGGLPGAMGGRGRGGRGKAMKDNKGTDAAEAAVVKALNWLQKNQNSDGSWGDATPEGKNHYPSMTGLAMLCFLGHGETTDSPQYGITVKRALDWMVENGTKNGGRLNMKGEFDKYGPYEHGIATYALGEYYAMTKDQQVLPLLKQAVDHITQNQSPGGGWSYRYDKMDNDLSISGWQIQALKAASLGDLKMNSIHNSLDKATDWLEKMKGPRSGFKYTPTQDERYSLTGLGILCHLFWNGKQGEVRKSMDWLLEVAGTEEPVKYNHPKANLYTWYYHTQACLMFGGKAWETWNGWFQTEMIKSQSPDGSWPKMNAGSIGGLQEGESKTSAVYRTTLSTLMLEVFYRYMPTFKS